MGRIGILVLAALALPLSALAQAPPPENTGPNTNIVRTITGKMTFRTISDQRHRGGEDFRVVVHPDGSRQIFVSKDFKAFNGQQTIIARVDSRFRPLETYASYWTRDGFKGSIYVTVTASELRAIGVGPKGRTEDVKAIGDNIAVVHHGEITNGWYTWMEDAKATGPQTSNAYILNAAPRGDAQVSGFMLETKFTRLGREKITTPAGTFETTHYQLAGPEALDMWIATEDRLLIRQTDSKNDREYVLTELGIQQNK
jgi:hypothetical protein